MELEVSSGRKSRRRRTRAKSPLGSKLRKYQLLLLVVFAIGLIGTAALALMKSSPAGPETWRAPAIASAHTAVRNAVREELQTSFANSEETRVEAQEGGKFFVSGWVDLIAADGQIDRQLFSCTVYQNEAGDWASEKLWLVPQ